MTIDEHDLPGLAAAVEIRVDRWGVPHIYADSVGDLFLAQGYNAARERLWQIDLWRRRGLGLLAEAFGPEFVERDMAARLFVFRGDMEAEWGAYDELVPLAARRFTEGVNAFVEEAILRPELLPEEFGELGYLPGRWAPEDVLRIRTNGRHHNAGSELARALAMRDFGEAVERLRTRLEPDRPIVVPPGLDLEAIPADALRLYRLAVAPFEAGALEEPQSVEVASAWGSNNWALAGSRTASGRPILANDPHRALTFPSMRYMVHLSAPGLELIGAGEPSVPGVAIGHNGFAAFGVTTFNGDQEDLYVYETDEEDARYGYDGGWEEFELVRELVPVRGEEPREITLPFTRHGPVVHRGKGAAVAVRAAWLEPGMAPYLGALSCLRAGSWPEFEVAAERWGYPGDNLVYADRDGKIAWKPAGRFPVRPGWDGLLPVPGDGRYEWDGFHDPRALPAVVDPDCGWVASANECKLPAASLERLNLGYEWLPPFRSERIAEVLEAAAAATVADSVALQSDYASVLARRVLRCLAGLTADLEDAAWGLGVLHAWDGELGPESAAAALFETWFRFHLTPALLREALRSRVDGGDVESALELVLPSGSVPTDPRPVLEILEAPGEHLGPGGDAVLAAAVEATLAAAVADLDGRLGEDRSLWSWGDLHRVELAHPARAWMPGLDPSLLEMRSSERGGSVETVGNGAYGRPDMLQTDGASWRMVLDVGAWDHSVAVNFPGQSGRLGDPHQLDLAEAWVRGEAMPMVFSRAAVEAATEQVTQLRPRP